MPSLSEMIDLASATRLDYLAACAAVWRNVQSHAPGLCRAIAALGLSEEQCAVWLCTPHALWAATPATLIASGRVDEVAALIEEASPGSDL